MLGMFVFPTQALPVLLPSPISVWDRLHGPAVRVTLRVDEYDPAYLSAGPAWTDAGNTRASCAPSRTQRPFMPRLSVRSSPLLPGMRLSQYPPNALSVYAVCLPLGFHIVWKRGGGSSRRFNSPAHASWRVGACLRAAAMTVRVEPGTPLKLPTEDMRDHRNPHYLESGRKHASVRCP
jgi:hypothetical protein